MVDLYVIELVDRIKIGQTTNLELRLKDITYTGGISPKEIRKCFHFPKCGKFEQVLLKLTEDEIIIGEWRTRHTPMISYFIEYLYLNNKVDQEIVERLATLSLLPKQKRIHFRNEWFFMITSMIYAERKGIGQSLRGKIRYDIQEKSITYKNWKYEITGDEKAPFIRIPKFSLENITIVHKRECIKIIRNRVKDKASMLSIKFIEEILDYLYNKNPNPYYLIDSDIYNLIGLAFFCHTLDDGETELKNYDDEELIEHVHFLACFWYFSTLNKDKKLGYLSKLADIIMTAHGESDFRLLRVSELKEYVLADLKDSQTDLYLQCVITGYFYPSNKDNSFEKDDWEMWYESACEHGELKKIITKLTFLKTIRAIGSQYM